VENVGSFASITSAKLLLLWNVETRNLKDMICLFHGFLQQVLLHVEKVVRTLGKARTCRCVLPKPYRS
jgi:hypothetical protein